MKLARLSIWLALPLLALSLTGCTPATLAKLAQASDNASIIMKGLESAVNAAHTQGLIPDADDLFIQQSVSTVASAGTTLDACIRGAGSTNGAVVCISGTMTQLQTLQSEGALHLKSPQAISDFSIAISSVQTLLASVETTVTGQAATSTN